MNHNLTIEAMQSKRFLGKFLIQNGNPVILLNETLEPEAKQKVLKHELRHFEFFQRHKLLSEIYEHKKTYCACLLCAFFLNPYVFSVVCIPQYILSAHEMAVSANPNFPSRKSFFYALLILIFYLTCTLMRFFL